MKDITLIMTQQQVYNFMFVVVVGHVEWCFIEMIPREKVGLVVVYQFPDNIKASKKKQEECNAVQPSSLTASKSAP